jgi:alanyl-tRNA synthetase
MNKFKSYEIEEKFESFFKLKKHVSLPSSSLIPENKNSSVLFNIA